MSTDTDIERLTRRIQSLSATDAQFAAARPDEAISAAIRRPGLRLPQLVQTVMERRNTPTRSRFHGSVTAVAVVTDCGSVGGCWAAGVPAPGVDAFPDGDGGDDQCRDRVGP